MTEILLHINSGIDRRPQDSPDNWVTYLANPIDVGTNSKVRILVDQIDFPNSAYTFPESSDTFYYIFNYNPNSTDPSYNILRSFELDTQRNYNTGNDLISALNTGIGAKGYNLAFSHNVNSSTLSIKNNESVPIRVIGSYRFSDRLDIAYNSIIDRLGFIQDLRTLSVAPGDSITGEGVLRLFRTNCYYLCCDITSSKIKQSQVPSPNYQPNIIGRISSSNFGNLSQLAIASSVWFNVSSMSSINRIAFSVLDDEFQPVNLNGQPIVFSLRFSF